MHACRRVFKEETFGPVIPLFSFSSEAEAVQLANDTVSYLLFNSLSLLSVQSIMCQWHGEQLRALHWVTSLGALGDFAESWFTHEAALTARSVLFFKSGTQPLVSWACGHRAPTTCGGHLTFAEHAIPVPVAPSRPPLYSYPSSCLCM